MPAVAQGRARVSDLRQAIDLHLQKLPSDAPIRGVIASRDVEERLARFDAADRIAINERNAYRRFGRVGLWAMLTGAIAGALVLLPLEAWKRELGPRTVVEGLQSVALIFTFAVIGWISVRRSVSRWMEARASAEAQRADVFRAIMRAGVASPALLPSVLACFKDAHLDWQLGFFRKRSREHKLAKGNTTPFRIAGYSLSVLALLLATIGLVNLVADWGWLSHSLADSAKRMAVQESGRWQLGLGAIGSSILAFASGRSLMDQDDRNAACYASAAAKLEGMVKRDLPEAQKAAAAGDAAPVMTFCERVQTILDAEHLAWSFTHPSGNFTIVPKVNL